MADLIKSVNYSQETKLPIIISYNANTQILFGLAPIPMISYLRAENFEILNRRTESTFVNRIRQE